ncbi:MAG: OmpA family protein [Heliobacteriaceae bacterium]|jgi:chemotaxis protein MotB|nr:OmpA family protein [Heliobacteriaceae bacterium]
MGMMAKKGGGDGPGENVFWTTMSDMMLGLFIVFLVLFLVALTGFSDSAAKEKQEQMEVMADLTDEMIKSDIKNVEIDKLTGDVKISDLELFDTGSAVLSPKGKVFLDKLIPLYINTIFSKPEIIDKVENFIVQGHTDSQPYKGITSKEEHFIRNMDLSTKRANAVAEYIFKTNYDKKYRDKLISMMVVEGKSYTQPVKTKDGKEDYGKSRRVELRLKTKKTDNIIDVLLGAAEQ